MTNGLNDTVSKRIRLVVEKRVTDDKTNIIKRLLSYLTKIRKKVKRLFTSSAK